MRRAILIVAALAGVAHADPAAPPAGLAVGVEVGEPSALSVAWLGRTLSFDAAAGTGTLAGVGFSAHADLEHVLARLGGGVPIRLGLGARVYHHGYASMSFDEIPDTHLGVRVPLSIAFERKSFQLYAEVAPGVDVLRTRSCNFVDGANSICPHAQSTPLFVQLDLGVRFFFDH